MKNWLLLIMILCTALVTSGFSAPLMNNAAPMTVQSIEENPNYLTVDLEFPSGELVTIEDGNGDPRLWLNIEGSVADFDSDGPALPVITRLVAVPAGYQLEAHVVSREDNIYEADRAIARDAAGRTVRSTENHPTVAVGEAGWMRWMRVAPVVIRPAHYDADGHRILAAENMTIKFDFIPDPKQDNSAPDPERYWSLAYETFFKGILLNPKNLPTTIPGGQIVQRGTYLIISNDTLLHWTDEFAEWKREKGFDVVLAPIYHQGITTEEIKDYIQDAYDNWERPLEFVLLIGDVNRAGIQLPSYRIQNPNRADEYDVTDLPYSCLQGDDYFPDVFIGRISTDSPTNSTIRNVLQRTLDHEQQTYRVGEQHPDYDEYIARFHQATIFAGNFGDGGSSVLSPVETSMWLAQRLRELNWDVEEFYYRGGRPGDTRTSAPIVESINRGVNVVSYRGWADASGTHYPEFYIDPDLDDLDNGPHLPVFTFFVCNTGDFGNDNQNPSFGEYAIDRGTRRNPAGALAFYGPSDLHTKTMYNNPMLAGYYTALMYKNIRTLGAVCLNAKMEIWKGFPWQQEMGARDNYVEFYFSVYNIQGDPELNIFFDAPQTIEVDHPNPLAVGATSIPFSVTMNNRPVAKALINLYKEDETEISLITDLDGIAYAPVNLLTTGQLRTTVLVQQAYPYREMIEIVDQNIVAFSSVEVSNEFGDERLVSGSPVALTVSLTNMGEADAEGVIATISSSLDNTHFDVDEVAFGDIAAGETSVGQQAYTLQIDPIAYPWVQYPFLLSIRDSEGNTYDAQFRLPVTSSAVKYNDVSFMNGSIEPGDTDDMVISVRNHGLLDYGQLTAELYTFDESVEIIDAVGTFPAFAHGESTDNADDPFNIRIRDETVNGRRITFHARFTDDQERYVGLVHFTITAGILSPTDPLGPDGYGYYAYESTDDARYGDIIPEYNWLELDPDHGGEGGQLHKLIDDQTTMMDLPFDFKFYGREFSKITICSNGWISFDSTAWVEFDSTLMYNFRNWELPSPLGPHMMICPFWEDLVGVFNEQLNRRDTLSIYTRYDNMDGRFVIQWSRVVARTSVDDLTETFQVILFDPAVHQTVTGDGEILFQYLDFNLVDRNEGNYASIGIQDWNHFTGLQATYAGVYSDAVSPIEGGRAILITTTRPDPFLDQDNPEGIIPAEFVLSEPYPNPFNSSTTVRFTIPENGFAKLALWDLNGRLVREIAGGEYTVGEHALSFSAQDVPSGLYLIRLESSGMAAQRKILLLK